MNADYVEAFPALASIYLENSWELSVLPSERMVAFQLDAVLLEEHPRYVGPRPGEQHDYRPATLLVEGPCLEVALSGLLPAQDENGATDLGNIDSWTVDEGSWSVLSGNWGTARVQRPHVRLLFDLDDARQ